MTKKFWKVKRILAEKVEGGVRHFLIRWKGWAKEFDSWESEDSVVRVSIDMNNQPSNFRMIAPWKLGKKRMRRKKKGREQERRRNDSRKRRDKPWRRRRRPRRRPELVPF